MPELNNSKGQQVEVPEAKDPQAMVCYGLFYLQKKIAELCNLASQPIDIRDQEQVENRDKQTQQLARLQKLRDQKFKK